VSNLSEDQPTPDSQVSEQIEAIAITDGYTTVLNAVVELMESARHAAARSVNALMTAAYWEIGRRIVEYEQGGEQRAGYGEYIIKRLSADLTTKLGRGFSQRNLEQMRRFYQTWPIPQTLSAESDVGDRFPLPWSHYTKLLSVKSSEARAFYEAEALRGGWSIRQLSRQINTQYYERTLLSRNKAAMLEKGGTPRHSTPPHEPSLPPAHSSRTIRTSPSLRRRAEPVAECSYEMGCGTAVPHPIS